ncbi:MAG: hypothetical protein Q9227_000585 [Pyrenula ochraceoflavens]
MGGPGSGGYKNSPGDVDVHEAWELLDMDPSSNQKLPQVRCRYCYKEHARHTSRQRTHLLTCDAYLRAMAEQGITNTITQQAQAAADERTTYESTPSRPPAVTASGAPSLSKKTFKQTQARFGEYPLATKIQALALAEANLSDQYIYESSGVDPRTLGMLRKVARDRGYDPAKSRALKEEYVTSLPSTGTFMEVGKKRPRDSDGGDTNGAGGSGSDSMRAPPGYMNADSLPPGNWNFTGTTAFST